MANSFEKIAVHQVMTQLEKRATFGKALLAMFGANTAADLVSGIFNYLVLPSFWIGPGLGLLGGWMLAHAQDPSFEPEDAQLQELISEYRRALAKMRPSVIKKKTKPDLEADTDSDMDII